MIRPLIAIGMLLCSVVLRAEIRVEDSTGRVVTLAEPARRIVALAPHIVENLFSAGAGERIVGTVDYADFPSAAAAIPSLGSAHAWSLEALVALDPDLVVMWGSGNGGSARSRLEQLGLTVYVSEPRRLEDISAGIRDFGALAGSSGAANTSADYFDAKLRQLRNRYAGLQAQTVFYQIWNNPLQTVNGEHMISAVMQLCGGRNVYADTLQLAPLVSLESVLQRNPDVIVASGMDASRPEWLSAWRKYPQLTAVRRGALFHIHPDLIQRPTVRIAQGATQLCEQLDTVRTH